MPATPYSYRQYAGNGATTTFSVPFPFLLRAHVKVYLGYNLLAGTFSSELIAGTDFSWNSDTQIQTTVAPANGTTLTVIRKTPADQLLVQWQDGSNLISENLLTSDKQNLYVVQEQEDVVFASSAQSTTAATNAAAAVTTANAASATANGIAGTANTALTTANTALTTANAASATATAAQTTANGIAGTANTALTTANAAVATANAADATANGIAGTANTALTNANAAVATANAADATATAAQTTANGIAATASAANTTANAAQATANAALPKAGGTMTGNIVFAGSQPTATTSAAAIVQLSSSTSSTSEALAATPKAVKDAYDLANGRGRITAETVQATTSGTNKDFSIPSWAKKIIVCVNDVSVNSTASIFIRLGTASSFEATNYIGSSSTTTAASNGTIALSTGFDLIGTSPSADAAKVAGNVMLILCDPATNTWTCSGSLGRTDLAATVQIGGRKALAAALTRIQIVSSGTFDSGSVNVLYEG